MSETPRELHRVADDLREGESIWLPKREEGGWGIVYNAEGVACRMLWFAPMTPEECALADELAAAEGSKP